MSRFGELRQPTLIIHGGRDDIVPPDVPARLDRILPDSELHWIARAGHMPQESHPAAVGAALVEFLTTRFPTVEEKA